MNPDADSAYDGLDPHERPHFVYRIFDKSDRLLYIGCTEDVDTRMYMHRTTYTMACSWDIHHNYDHHTSEAHDGLAAARAAERHAIATEAPLLNRQHNPTRWRRVNGQWTPIGSTADDLAEMTEANRPPFDPRIAALIHSGTFTAAS